MSELASVVCKFGGTSVADAGQLERVAAIVRSDPRRRFVVVSAPGKRHGGDTKITDLLYLCHHSRSEGIEPRDSFGIVRERFEAVGRDLGVAEVSTWIDEVEAELNRGAPRDWVASRGEYLHARVVAAYLGARFVDASECIGFGSEGRLDPNSYERTRRVVEGGGLVVIPGFYGLDARGHVRTFSRGGSDVTGAIVARAVGAETYENWTDVDGLLMADPRVVPHPRPIREVTYTELRELAYMGATVLHDEAVFPVRDAGIPINLRNTNAPDRPGTWIVSERADGDFPIIGVAGRRGFTTIYLEKTLMNQERGFGRRLLEVLEHHGISYEHAPSGIDTMSVIMQEEELDGCEEAVMDDIKRVLEPERLEMLHGMALIATVGQGMSHRVGVAGRLFAALAEAGVNIRMINQGASENNIIVGVSSEDYERAVRSIYTSFVPDS